MKISYILFALIVIVSCNTSSEKEKRFDQLMTEVIEIHDEVMPKMSDISQLISELKKKADTTQTGKAYQEAQSELEESYDFMMTWMSDFSNKFPHNEEVTDQNESEFDAKLRTLEEEKVEVTLLRDQINTSITNARALLQD